MSEITRKETVAGPITELDLPPLLSNEELGYLNRNFGLDREVPPASGGFVHRIKHRLKRLIARLVFGSLAGYFTDEQEFRAHLVRFQNTTARSLDAAVDQTNRLTVGMVEAIHIAERAITLHHLLEERMNKLLAEKEI